MYVCTFLHFSSVSSRIAVALAKLEMRAETSSSAVTNWPSTTVRVSSDSFNRAMASVAVAFSSMAAALRSEDYSMHGNYNNGHTM